MAIEGGYEPFAVDIDAPDGASAEAAVAAAAHRILAPLPAGAGGHPRPGIRHVPRPIPDGQAKTDGWRPAKTLPPHSLPCGPTTASGPR